MKLLFTFLVFVGVVSSAGAQWKQCGPRGENIRTLTGVGNTIFAIGMDSIYKSEVGSIQWQSANMPFSKVDNIQSNGTVLFVTSNKKGLYRSFDSGISWELSKDTIISNASISILSVDDSILIAYDSQAKRLYRSANNGDTWEIIPIGFDGYIVSLKSMGNVVFVGTESKGIFRSTDIGVTWTSVNTGINPEFGSTYFDVHCFASIGDILITSTNTGFFRSIDYGEHWTASNIGYLSNIYNTILVADSQLYAIAKFDYGGVFKSTDKGEHWTQVNWGMIGLTIQSLAYIKNTLYAGTNGGGVFRSINSGRNWSSVNAGFPYQSISSLVAKGDTLFAVTGNIGMFRSIDHGESWSEVNIGVICFRINSLAVNGSTIFAGTYPQGVLRSDDNGEHWMPCDSMLMSDQITKVIVSNSTVFALSDGANGVFQSYDNGIHWVRDTSYTKWQTVISLALKDTSLFLGTDDNQVGIIRSYFKEGIGKSRILGVCCGYYPIAVSGPNVIVGGNLGTTNHLLISKDDGITWKNSTLSFNDFFASALNALGNSVFTYVDHTVYQSFDNGDNFIRIDTLSDYVSTFEVIDKTLYAATGKGIWKREISITDVQEETPASTPHLSIYPNPTTTSITVDRALLPFTIGAVNYTILSVTGEKVYDVEQSESRFTLSVDGLPSGVYSLVARQGVVRSAVVFTVVR